MKKQLNQLKIQKKKNFEKIMKKYLFLKIFQMNRLHLQILFRIQLLIMD